jgi:putative xylitol transport system substrate-binding protein/inositol transport system substrate-binding protein
MPEAIGLFLRSEDNYYQRRLREVGEREAKRHGFELLVQSVKFDASQQVVQIREAIQNASVTNMVAVLVSGVHDQALAPVAHEAAVAGLEWGLLNDATFIDEVRSQHPERAIFAATCDHTEIGRIHGQQVRALLGDAGRVLCVTGNLQNEDARQRLQGLKESLDAKFDLIEVNADWTSEGARRAVEKWARSTTKNDLPRAFVAQNDEMALGVRQALRDLDSQHDWPLASAPITGCDGAENFGQRLVREGRLKATVIMPPGTGVAIEWIARLRKGGPLPPLRVRMPVTSFPALSRLKT